MLNFGDLVQLDSKHFLKGECNVGIFIQSFENDLHYYFLKWGEQVVGECDCEIIWQGQTIPYYMDSLIMMQSF